MPLASQPIKHISTQLAHLKIKQELYLGKDLLTPWESKIETRNQNNLKTSLLFTASIGGFSISNSGSSKEISLMY